MICNSNLSRFSRGGKESSRERSFHLSCFLQRARCPHSHFSQSLPCSLLLISSLPVSPSRYLLPSHFRVTFNFLAGHRTAGRARPPSWISLCPSLASLPVIVLLHYWDHRSLRTKGAHGTARTRSWTALRWVHCVFMHVLSTPRR